MANFTTTGSIISLSQVGRDISPTSSDENSEHSPHSTPTTLPNNKNTNKTFSSSKSKKQTTNNDIDNIGSCSVPKKPRGRPPGSKNRPKPPVVITKENESSLKPILLEISAGSDIVESLIDFARKRQIGITVLSCSGSVSNVTLRHPLSHAPSLSLHGPFNLLSLSGSFIVGSKQISFLSSSGSCFSFGICLAGAQGQVFGGIVGGKVIASSVVVVVVTTFQNATFHSLPSENDEVEETKMGSENNNNNNINKSGGNEGSVCLYGSVGSPTPINCRISPPPPPHDVMPWSSTVSRPPY